MRANASAFDFLGEKPREADRGGTAFYVLGNDAPPELKGYAENIVAGVPWGLLVLSADLHVVSANRSFVRTFGLRDGEVTGRPLEEVLPVAGLRERVEHVLRTGAPQHNIFFDWPAAEGSRLLRVAISSMGQGGAGARLFLVVEDLTEVERLRSRAAEARAHLLERVMAAQEEERGRIARDLHDGIGQLLTSLLIGLRTIEQASTLQTARERAEEMRGIAAGTLDEVRRLARGLRPSVLDDLGLVAALERSAADFARAQNIPVDVQAVGLDADRLPAAVETALYRIVQEALTNTAKHAAARTVSIVLERRPEQVQVIVEDDGRGFDSTAWLQSPEVHRHFGLSSMRERAALLNGTLTVESRPGGGTTIHVCIPIRENNHGQDSRPSCR